MLESEIGSPHSAQFGRATPISFKIANQQFRMQDEDEYWGVLAQKFKGRGRFSSPLHLQAILLPESVEPEVNFDVDLHRHRAAVLHCRLEFPLAHGFNGFLVETHAQAARNLDIARLTVLIHDQP